MLLRHRTLTLSASLGILAGALLAGSPSATGLAVDPSADAVEARGCQSVAIAASDFDHVYTAGEKSGRLAKAQNADFVLLPGDIDQRDGTYWHYVKAYGRSPWHDLFDITKVAPGNHDYKANDGAGFFRYFGTPKYYAFDLGCGWRGYSLNSEERTNAQLAWLKADLAAHPDDEVVAFWHRPEYTSGRHTGTDKVTELRKALAGRSGIVINGHTPHYERFAVKDGLRHFIAGTAGTASDTLRALEPNSVKAVWNTSGLLRLDLTSNGQYTFKFIGVDGKVYDQG